MSAVDFEMKCPRCSNPRAEAWCSPKTHEELISCPCFGFYKSRCLTKKFWELTDKEQNFVDFNDETWWILKEEIQFVGISCGWLKIGKQWYFRFKDQDEIESFKQSFHEHKDIIIAGKNYLSEFNEKKGVFLVTNLDSMTTQDYLPEDYFKEFPLDDEE